MHWFCLNDKQQCKTILFRYYKKYTLIYLKVSHNIHTISKCLLKLAYINLIRDLIRGHRPVTTKTTGEQWTAPAAYWVCIRGKTFPCKSSHSSLSVSHAFTCTRMQTHNAHTDSRKQARLFTELKHAACMMNGFLRKLSSSLSSTLFFPVFPTRPSSSSLSASAFVFWKSPCSLVFHKSLQGSSFYPLDTVWEAHCHPLIYHKPVKYQSMTLTWSWGWSVKSAHLKSSHTEVGQQKPSFKICRGFE